MSKLEKLKKKLGRLKVLLIVIPIVYAFSVRIIKKTSKKAKMIIAIITIGFIITYFLVVGEYFKTKREIYKLQGIELTIEKAKPELEKP